MAPIVWVGALLCLTPSSSAQGLDEVVERVRAYVEQYGRELGSVVADERYEQRVSRSNEEGAGAAERPAEERRELRSEFLLVHMPGSDAQWVGFRDVIEVDGQPVDHRRERLLDLVTEGSGSWRDIARAYVKESARYNLGEVSRNLNVPTFGLELLTAARRDRFSVRKRAEVLVEGQRLWLIELRERGAPPSSARQRAGECPCGSRRSFTP